MKLRAASFLVLFTAAANGIGPYVPKDIPEEEVKNACGIMCFSLCCHLLDVEVDTAGLLKRHPPSEKGTNLLELEDMAAEHGLYSLAIRCGPEELLCCVSLDRPAIIRSSLQEHFYVVTGLVPGGEEVRLYDAIVFRPMAVTRETLNELFRGEAMILSRNPISVPGPNAKEMTAVSFICVTGVVGLIWLNRRKQP